MVRTMSPNATSLMIVMGCMPMLAAVAVAKRRR
jgi:hypothetical protein